MFVARCNLSESASILTSGDSGLTLNFWKRVIKGRRENIIHAIHSEVSRQRKGCECVCVGGNLSDSTTIKPAVFCNFDWTYLSLLSITPLRYSI
jgi:hypothetical protein